jgi:hypothetical protein
LPSFPLLSFLPSSLFLHTSPNSSLLL